jgi:chromosome segregation ATPase
VEGLSLDLDNSQRETRNASSELFRVKNAYEESVLQLDEVRRENRALSTEIKDIMDQITEGGRSIHEIDKIRLVIYLIFLILILKKKKNF